MVVFMMAGCALGRPGSETAAVAVSPEAQAPTVTLPPTSTSTSSPPLVILVLSPTADPILSASLQPLLAELSQRDGMLFETRPALSPGDWGTAPKLVVAVGLDDASLAGLVSTAPQTQFLTVGASSLAPSANLSLVLAQAQRPDLQGFLAGYIAAAVTQDWRVAVISEAGSVPGKAARSGFTNGMFFFCGLCRPVYPPFPIPGYPLYWELPVGAAQGEWEGAIAYFKEWGVRTVFISGQVADEVLLEALAGAGLNLISDKTPPAGLEDKWIASVGSASPDEAVRKLWPDLINGVGSARIELSLRFSNVNETLFSPGRQQYVNIMLEKLVSGLIDTGVDLNTGERR